ncbi:DUF21 domain-containing protein At2g14520-like isoform X3 [Mercurialis annua]|uniref:DUF21 domain-containing protein At2g14520-like isoform X3 n=1 Tax=Mercurialis annua TaxID=3986 RepID=UPI00215EE579|nr:DUF21 domain-containing protein At2g14520-like isoform X3 [Mercurialis annua]
MEVEYRCCGTGFFIHIAIIIFLVLFAGLMSGLTLGLMSLSLVDLEVLAKSGTPSDRKHATKIFPVVKNQHLLLCTLLICNAAAMEALPIFLDSMVTAWGAVLISVTLILLFGEVIPQAVCARYGLAIGAAVAPIVRVLVCICFPIAYPISKAGKGGELSRHETTIITGALELTDKMAKDAMTPISETFSIDINAKLNNALTKLMLEKGHSRVPVYHENPKNIIGLVLVKNLLTIRPEDEVPVMNATIRKIPRVSETMPLYTILNEFQKGHSHMAVVIRQKSETEQLAGEDVRVDIEGERHTDVKSTETSRSRKKLKSFPIEANPQRGESKSKKRVNGAHPEVLRIYENPLTELVEEGEAIGIITLKDVIEELLQGKIFDETDYRDGHH